MKQLVLGILAHVDAGKTTLSEALLYRTGAIRDLGRVDHKNAHLDTHALERARGITIFSRQARLTLGDTAVTLLDTPGHVDFSAEMERTLQVLDYAVLVISGTDGVQAHTETLWQLLRRYRVPVFVFVTKMDLPGADRAALMADLRAHLSGACVDFTDPDPEQIALCDEAALEQYLDTGALPDETVRALIRSRKLFPCLFGSGLKLTGVDAFLAALERYAAPPEYPAEFGARVFKIMRDAQGNRLTCLKVTGGQLRVRTPLTYFPRGADAPVQEKVNAIRLYSGEKFESAETVPAGGVCAVQGLTQTYLSHLFREQLHIPFQDYLGRLRLEAAMLLLRQSDTTLTDAAYACGFSDPKYLNQSFLKNLGMTPRQWLQENRPAPTGETQSKEDSRTAQHILTPDECRALLDAYGIMPDQIFRIFSSSPLA